MNEVGVKIAHKCRRLISEGRRAARAPGPDEAGDSDNVHRPDQLMAWWVRGPGNTGAGTVFAAYAPSGRSQEAVVDAVAVLVKAGDPAR